MKIWLFLGCLSLCVAISSETDLRPNRSEALKLWRRVRNFAENDPPEIVTPQSPAWDNGKEHGNDGGKADLSNSARTRQTRGFTQREARCERVGGGVGKAASVPGPHTPIHLASRSSYSYISSVLILLYMCPHYYWRRLQMSCAASPAAALIPTDKINSVVRTDW